MRKLETPCIKETVVKQLAVGVPQNSIAEQFDVDQSQVSRFANKDEVRELIEQEQMKLVEVVPDAVENVKTLVEGMKNEKDIQRLQLAYKATQDTLRATGLFPSPQFAHNIYNDNRIQTHNSVNNNIASLVGKATLEKILTVDENE